MQDEQIIALYWQRDAQAIQESEHKYGAYCSAIAQNILGDAEDSREAVNDTWLSAWQSMPPQLPQRLQAFLGRITRNISFNRRKAARAEKRGGGQLPLVLDELAECVSGTGDVTDKLAAQELSRALNEFLLALPQQQRDIFICRYWYTQSSAEIAARFAMRPGAVDTLLHRLRKQLRQFLQKRGLY